MNTKSFLYWRASMLILAVGLALSAVGLIVWEAEAGTTSRSIDRQVSSPQLSSTSNDISGTVFYSGTVTGTHLVWVGAFTTAQGGPPVYSILRNGTGPYTLTVEPGTYHIMGGMDADDSGGPPDPTIDPIGVYANNPLTVTAETVITGADIFLVDPSSPPTSSISGWISYTGQITGTHNTIIFAIRQGEQGPPAYSTVISGIGPYTLPNVADGTYTVGAYMDLGGDMGPPEPDEPFGWYDLGGDKQPDPVIISGGNAATGVNITLLDSLRYNYLPLILKIPVP